MEGVTAWLRAQVKAVTVMPELVYMAAARSSEMSSVTCSVDEPRERVAADIIDVVVVQPSVSQIPLLPGNEEPSVIDKTPVS